MRRIIALFLLVVCVTVVQAANLNNPNVRIQYIIDDGKGFRDALYFTQAEYAAMTDAQVKALADARVAAYYVRLAQSSAAAPPTKAELQAELAEMQARVAEINSKIGAAK